MAKGVHLTGGMALTGPEEALGMFLAASVRGWIDDIRVGSETLPVEDGHRVRTLPPLLMLSPAAARLS